MTEETYLMAVAVEPCRLEELRSAVRGAGAEVVAGPVSWPSPWSFRGGGSAGQELPEGTIGCASEGIDPGDGRGTPPPGERGQHTGREPL